MPAAGAIAPLQTAGLGFPAAMQPMNPMLATWMNINTDGFAQDPYMTPDGIGMSIRLPGNVVKDGRPEF